MRTLTVIALACVAICVLAFVASCGVLVRDALASRSRRRRRERELASRIEAFTRRASR